MTYQAGNIVLLNNGKSAYVLTVDDKAKKYQVVDVDDDSKIYVVSENAIMMLLT
jgi:hypothetical protein